MAHTEDFREESKAIPEVTATAEYLLKPVSSKEIIETAELINEKRDSSENSMGATSDVTAEERMEQFRELMNDIVGHAISLNNEELSQIIGQEVQERVLKEMNYLAREQDEAQEERYKKLDAAIRGN